VSEPFNPVSRDADGVRSHKTGTVGSLTTNIR
jgi:hypothetical protein